MDEPNLTLKELRELEPRLQALFDYFVVSGPNNTLTMRDAKRALRELLAVREEQDPLLIGYDLALKRLELLRAAMVGAIARLKEAPFADRIENTRAAVEILQAALGKGKS